MANAFLKPSVIAAQAVGLLYRRLVVARTLWTDAINPGEFNGALNDTVTMRVPARRTARRRTLRAGTPITNDASNEFGVPVQLTTDVYNGAPITDEELTLDIADFGAQVLVPQIRAVAEGVEDEAIAAVADATYRNDMIVDPSDTEFQVGGQTDWYRVAARAGKLLDQKHVPEENRFMLVGADIKEEIVVDDRFNRADSTGEAAALDMLRRRVIGTIAGFTVISSVDIEPDEAFAYHKTAFVLATRAPRVPQGATMAAIRSLGEAPGEVGYVGGLSCRWLMDYDYTNTTDRSLVNTWVGHASVTDPDTPSNPASTKSLYRAVKIVEGS